MKKLLITGFSTFSNHSENSSQIITELFKNTKLDGFEVRTAILPVAFSAGTYVCNYIMYRLLDYCQDSRVEAGFIHLPHLEKNQQVIFDTLVKMINSSRALLS